MFTYDVIGSTTRVLSGSRKSDVAGRRTVRRRSRKNGVSPTLSVTITPTRHHVRAYARTHRSAPKSRGRSVTARLCNPPSLSGHDEARTFNRLFLYPARARTVVHYRSVVEFSIFFFERATHTYTHTRPRAPSSATGRTTTTMRSVLLFPRRANIAAATTAATAAVDRVLLCLSVRSRI